MGCLPVTAHTTSSFIYGLEGVLGVESLRAISIWSSHFLHMFFIKYLSLLLLFGYPHVFPDLSSPWYQSRPCSNPALWYPNQEPLYSLDGDTLLLMAFMHYFYYVRFKFLLHIPYLLTYRMVDTSIYLVSNNSICITLSWTDLLLWMRMWPLLLLWSAEVFLTLIQCLGHHNLWILPQAVITKKHWTLNDVSWWIRRFGHFTAILDVVMLTMWLCWWLLWLHLLSIVDCYDCRWMI